MNLIPDPRQLVSSVKLSVMNAPDSGFFTGDYTATTQTKSLDNLNVLNYDFESSIPLPDGTSEPKYSNRLQILSSLQNSRIPEVNTAVSASSCTFAFGGIVPNETHPNFNKLKGPAYPVNFVDDPSTSAINRAASITPNSSLHVPKIPFIGSGNVLTTYNIWNVVNSQSTDAIKFIGPKVTGNATGTLKTINDPNGGASVEISSIDKVTTVERIFATSFDAVYQDGAEVHNPDGTREAIKARGTNGGNGFHLNFSASNMETDTSLVTVYLEPVTRDDRYINRFAIDFKLNKRPVIKIYNPAQGIYQVQSDIIAPVFDKNTMNSYDIFVHFVGPCVMFGFSPDISRWNTIVPSVNEVFCPADTKIFIQTSNVNLRFRYSAIIFNNFNNNQVNNKKNHIIAQFVCPEKLATNPELMSLIYEQFEKASYRINDFPGSTGFNDNTNPLDKNISYFADLRIPKEQKQYTYQFLYANQRNLKETKSKRYNFVFKLIYNTTIEGPAYMQVEMPHPGILGKKLGFDMIGNQKDGYGFKNPTVENLLIPVADVTEFLESWTVNCSHDGSNMSILRKSATIILKNLDTTNKGFKVINAIENNLICVTLDAGYLNGVLYPYFQGFITNVSYSRTGSSSTFTLQCVDVLSYTLENIYFEKSMMIAGMRHDYAIDSIMAASGFWSYYFRDNTQITGMNLRLNTQSVNNQDLIKLTPVDKILGKLQLIIERLNVPGALPTFRWAENFGFVLAGRYREEAIDNDLKFTGITDGKVIDVPENALVLQNAPLADPGWHGLLTNSYTINTDMRTLAAGVKAFASSITGFLADERINDTFYPADPRDYNNGLTLLDKLSIKKDFISPDNPFSKPYIGFRKYIVSSLQRNSIPDQKTLENITDQIEKIISTPVSKISFNCYVTKPLKFHGTFVIGVFGKTVDYTDKYIYDSISYRLDKKNNVITADVEGINIPFLIKDIK
jgi:hypothetical protein